MEERFIKQLPIQRQKLSKNQRQLILEKYNSKCAYCGCNIDIKNMHIDHLIPFMYSLYEEDKNIVDKVNEFDNYMPSCASCNRYKNTFNVEAFRNNIYKLYNILSIQKPLLGLLERYGLIEIKDKKIIFEFEKYKNFKEKNNDN